MYIGTLLIDDEFLARLDVDSEARMYLVTLTCSDGRVMTGCGSVPAGTSADDVAWSCVVGYVNGLPAGTSVKVAMPGNGFPLQLVVDTFFNNPLVSLSRWQPEEGMRWH